MNKLLLPAALLALSATLAQADTNGPWNYTIEGGQATIVKYTNPYADLDTMFNVDIPATLGGAPVTAIGESAFEGEEAILYVSLPKGILHIGNRAFYGCSSMSSEPDLRKVESIGDSAFYGTNLYNIYFDSPDNLTIGNGAFVTKSMWSDSEDANGTLCVSEEHFSAFRQKFGSTAFAMHFAIEPEYHPVREVIYDDNGLIYTKGLDIRAFGEGFPGDPENTGGVLSGRWTQGVVTVPAEVNGHAIQVIGESAFRDMPRAFDVGNENVTAIILPESVEYMGISAFLGCTNLETIFLNKMKYILYAAFINCNKLKSIYLNLPASDMEGIEPYSFINMGYEGEMEEGMYIPAIIYVPAGQKSAYEEKFFADQSDDLLYFYEHGRIQEGTFVPPTDVTGDVSGDGSVDVDDINVVINMMLNKTDKTEAADINGDGMVDIDDLNIIINIMVGKN